MCSITSCIILILFCGTHQVYSFHSIVYWPPWMEQSQTWPKTGETCLVFFRTVILKEGPQNHALEKYYWAQLTLILAQRIYLQSLFCPLLRPVEPGCSLRVTDSHINPHSPPTRQLHPWLKAWKWRVDEVRGKDVRDIWFSTVKWFRKIAERDREKKMEVEWSWWLLRECSIVERKSGSVQVERKE